MGSSYQELRRQIESSQEELQFQVERSQTMVVSRLQNECVSLKNECVSLKEELASVHSVVKSMQGLLIKTMQDANAGNRDLSSGGGQFEVGVEDVTVKPSEMGADGAIAVRQSERLKKKGKGSREKGGYASGASQSEQDSQTSLPDYNSEDEYLPPARPSPSVSVSLQNDGSVSGSAPPDSPTPRFREAFGIQVNKRRLGPRQVKNTTLNIAQLEFMRRTGSNAITSIASLLYGRPLRGKSCVCQVVECI